MAIRSTAFDGLKDHHSWWSYEGECGGTGVSQGGVRRCLLRHQGGGMMVGDGVGVAVSVLVGRAVLVCVGVGVVVTVGVEVEVGVGVGCRISSGRVTDAFPPRKLRTVRRKTMRPFPIPRISQSSNFSGCSKGVSLLMRSGHPGEPSSS